MDNTITIIVGSLSVSIVGILGLESFTHIKPITLLLIPFFYWYWTPWVLLGLVIVAIFARYVISKLRFEEKEGAQILRGPPPYSVAHRQDIVNREYGGVIWKVFLGSDFNPSQVDLTRAHLRVWVDYNPRCPVCDYELERQRHRWFCTPCNKDYSIPRNLRIDTDEKMRRIFDRYIVQWGGHSFGIAEQAVKQGRDRVEKQ